MLETKLSKRLKPMIMVWACLQFYKCTAEWVSGIKWVKIIVITQFLLELWKFKRYNMFIYCKKLNIFLNPFTARPVLSMRNILSISYYCLYANSWDPYETLSNSASHPDPSCLSTGQHFHVFWATLKHFEYWSRREI